MQALLLTLLRALAPQILNTVNEHIQATGNVPTPAELDAKLVAQADQIIAKGEDWLEKHKE